MTLDPQSGTGGSTSVSATYDSAMPSATGPTRSGYTFGGYYTETGGSGTQYYTSGMASSRNWDLTANTTLYAKWTTDAYTVTLDPQSGTGGSTSVSATYGSAMPSATGPTRSGYTFGGYYTQTGGSGTQYYTSGMASARNWDLTANTTLYAKWTADAYTVTLDPQSGTGGSTSVSATYDSAMPSATGPTRSGYTFGGYYTETGGSGTQYYTSAMASAQNWDLTANTTLYAQWTADAYTVSLDPQSGTGGSTSVSATYDSAMPSATAPTRSGYTFGGYYTETGGSGTQYYTSAMASSRNWDLTANTTLYAKWTVLPTKVALTGPATLNVGTVSTVFTLTSQDAGGNAANVTEATVFNLTSNTTGTSTFYSNAAGTTAITQVTIANGSSTAVFYYKDTAAGTPTVTVTRTSGMALGADTHQVTVEAGVVSGTVFNDLNGNGIQDAGELGISGVTIELLNSDGTDVETVATDGDGGYRFNDVNPGSYTVRETDPDGYASTTGNSVPVSVAAGGSATANFGDQQQGTVSGNVFEDNNGNGVQESDEFGIHDVAVELVDDQGSVLQTERTNEVGNYSFSGVGSGNYTVRETDPVGYSSTTSNSMAVLVVAGGSATASFGDREQGTVSGKVFNDANGNGVQDAGEPGIGDVTIKLLDSQGATAQTDTTDGDGSYRFSGVTPGNYTVLETDPTGYSSTTSNSAAVVVTSGGSGSANFGDREQGTVSGKVFNDMDGSGIQDAGEPGISGVSVKLLNNAGSAVQSVTSDGNGSYSFTSVDPGNYTVLETDPTGYSSTTSNSVAVVVASGGSGSANFGDQEQGTVSGKVFNDLNGNGLQDTGENGIGGVTVELLDDQGSNVQTGATVGDGSYLFSSVAPGLYMVRETDPEGYASTTNNTASVSVGAAGSATACFGDRKQGIVSGKVFNDLNGNGLQDTEDTGIGGVTVKLVNSEGVTDQTGVTVGDGIYSFSVPPGRYVIEETDPSGYSSTTNNSVPVSLVAGGLATANFGDQEQGTVLGKVFSDFNGNGFQDKGENGIGEVTVKLLDRGGSVVQTTTTLGNGGYSFSGVASGSYKVEEIDPDQYASTTDNTVPVSVTAAGAATANFGDQEQGTISGIVFDDANGNGVQDPGEKGIGGVSVKLLNSGGGTVSITETAGNGSFRFSDLAAGIYTMEETDPEGYGSTTNNTVKITVGSGAAATANFGDLPYGTVSGVVYNDTNGNGVQDPGEKGICGVTVNLLNGQNSLFATVTTAGDGVYLFHNVPAGTYTVEQIYPLGYTGTTANRVVVTVGVEVAADNAASSLSRGVSAANFGVLQQETVSGIVFNDSDGNGIQDPGENGVGGVMIRLLDGQETEVSNAITAGDGTYGYYNVSPGAYTVAETYPIGYTGTTSQNVNVTVATEGVATANFGILQGDAPDHVTLTGPSSVLPGVVSEAFTLTSKDDDGNRSNVTENTVFSLSSTAGAATFYSDSAGTDVITEVPIADGNSDATFYYKDSATGSPTITATRTSGMALGADTHQITVNADTATKVDLTGPATVNAGAVSTAFTLTSQDAGGNAANVTEATVFKLSSNSTGIKTFYSNASRTSVTTEVTIANGSSTAAFYYKDTAAGTPTVTATQTSGMSLGADTHQLTVNADTATKVDLTGPATVNAGEVSTAFTLTSKDGSGNTANVTEATVFKLSSNSTGIKTFYSNASRTSVTTDVTIANGSSTAAFYYKDTAAGTPTVTADQTTGMSLGWDTHPITVSLSPTILATSTSIPQSFKDFKVTVTKIEMYNGVSFVTIFSGPPAELDLVNGGTFDGISDLSLPAGTYNKIKVTFKNSLPVTGQMAYEGATYYTTGAAFGGESNVASDPSNASGSQTVFTFRISDWGALDEAVEREYDIAPPVTVDSTTDYQPTLRFTISNTFLLKGTAGTTSTYYLTLSAPTVSIVAP